MDHQLGLLAVDCAAGTEFAGQGTIAQGIDSFGFRKLIYSICACAATDAQGEGVRLNRCSFLFEMDGRMITPNEVSSGVPTPQKPRQNLNRSALHA